MQDLIKHLQLKLIKTELATSYTGSIFPSGYFLEKY
tara:strand:+ start:2266 stop:2373 length:108 start_codon:yes stop_codon:yes gene_type:complete